MLVPQVELTIRSEPPWPLAVVSNVDVDVAPAVFVVGQTPPTGVVAALVNEVRFESPSSAYVRVVHDPSKLSPTPVRRAAPS